jgi:hypothetical protein
MKTVNTFIGRLVLLLTILSASIAGFSQTSTDNNSPSDNSNYVLVVTDLISFTGKWKDNSVKLECKLAPDHAVTKIYIERSQGSGSFERIAEINPEGATTINYTDATAPGSNNLYRIALYKKDNKFAFSKTLRFDNRAESTLSLQVYPTVISGSAMISVSSGKAVQGTLQITDMNGHVLSQRAVSIQQGTTATDLDAVNTLTRGNYIVVLQTGSERSVQRIIVQ